MLRTLFLVCLPILLMAACTPTMNQHGNLVEDDQLAQLQSGVSTRSDVLRTIGSPTTVAPFHPHIWYYMSQETQKKGIFDPSITDERIVVVAFDEEGIVEEFGELDVNRVDLVLEDETTATHGHKLTFAQQVLGNLGRFNQGGAANSPNPAQ